MTGFLDSAAVNTALELRLFWRLADKPQNAEGVSRELGIPLNRCHCWLELLRALGLLDLRGGLYVPSALTTSSIIQTYSPEIWEHLALEGREEYRSCDDLAIHISNPVSVWKGLGGKGFDYVTQMTESPERARRFTRMLYELHQSLAEELAGILDMTGVKRLMDLGGGSGVISLALLNRHPDLTSVVVDIENVCETGRVIAAENSMSGRIAYHAADIVHGELPTGFDMVLECDVGIHDENLFRKARRALVEKGRLVIVDDLYQVDRPPSSWLRQMAFYKSLTDPEYEFPSTTRVKRLLTQTGYNLLSERNLKGSTVIIEARR
jgi:ubiquinone/menaquinone biosynthesis C-methylase UbiE